MCIDNIYFLFYHIFTFLGALEQLTIRFYRLVYVDDFGTSKELHDEAAGDYGEMPSSIHVPRLLAMMTRAQ